jgi:tetratricopeptide (TPR) repeat protein
VAARALVALDPDVAHARHALAWSLVMQRRFAEAEEGMEATLRIDPSHRRARANLAHLQMRRGALEGAIASYRGLSSPPASDSTEYDALCLGLALRAAGRRAEATAVPLAAAESMKARGRRSPLDAGDEGLLAALLAVAGRGVEAKAILARAALAGEPPGPNTLWLARGFAAVADADKAAALVESALAAGREADPYFVLVDPSLAAVRDRPGVDRLLPPGVRPAS